MTTSTKTAGDTRKTRTRAALVRAAQQLIAESRTSVPILEITQLADVGMGSFYNHFSSREALFQAAVDDALELQGSVLDALSSETEDPAEVFAQSFRLTGRMHRLQPELSRVLLSQGTAQVRSGKGLGPRALRDIKAASDAGRFHVADQDAALLIIGGAAIALGEALLDDPTLDDAQTTDRVTEDILRMLGLSAEDAADVVRRPLPELDRQEPPTSG